MRLICLMAAGAISFQTISWSQTNPSTVKQLPSMFIVPAGGKFFGQKPPIEKNRHYYIAAEAVNWEYAPEGKDVVCGKPLPPQMVTNKIASKIRYVQYTDATFGTKVKSEPSLGILGPVMRGVVGEYLDVTFWNRTGQPLSIHPHGVKYDKDSEGANYGDSPGRGGSVKPNNRYKYVWKLDESSGPKPGEPSSKAWLYHSHVTGDEEINMGLMGFIVVTDPQRARADGTPSDIDREFGALFMIFDESGMSVADKEAIEHGKAVNRTWAEIQQLNEQGSRYAINGRVFGNLHGLEMNEGERVRWYLFALGSESDFHTAHWHGVRVSENQKSTDVVELLPASMKVADMTADSPGTWLFHCHVAEHMQEGMFTSFRIHAKEEGWMADSIPRFLGMPPIK